ncbi:hypothetical protein BKG68_23410 [Mycobacteroides saopaulense]|uniref:Uncharacterized protein n=1 Tax=Mycobacteroides saopaulense TaxID=1578165 RepID=A0ABX3BWH4_9MYCO|nr:hypothetical protein BKG68_23410 [Mycobacteroides saopaulense]OHU07342.1 hypothetical protein BKG73_19015 [Mycobacteroides saopaulense]
MQLTREIVEALLLDGTESAETFLRMDQAQAALGGGHQRMLDAYGDKNGFSVTSSIRMPRGSVTRFHLEDVILPPIYSQYPISDVGDATSMNWIPGPYGFRSRVERLSQVDPYDTIRVVSPRYFGRYRTVGTYPGRYVSHWPLDPIDEREPLIYPDEPRRAGLPRRDVLGVAEYTLAAVNRWSEYLGCQVGDTHSSWHLNWKNPAVQGYETYVITAPVALTTTETEIGQRALPHTAVSAPLNGASREPSSGHQGRSPLVTFNIFNGLRANINDIEIPGKFVLTISSDGYRAH